MRRLDSALGRRRGENAAAVARAVEAAPHRRVFRALGGLEFLGPDVDPALPIDVQPAPPKEKPGAPPAKPGAPKKPPTPEEIEAERLRELEEAARERERLAVKAERERRAVYMQPDGALLDVMYRPTAAHIRVPDMPTPEAFNDYEDFEQAVLDWKTVVQDILGAIQLPRILGRSLYRPRLSNRRGRSNSGSSRAGVSMVGDSGAMDDDDSSDGPAGMANRLDALDASASSTERGSSTGQRVTGVFMNDVTDTNYDDDDADDDDFLDDDIMADVSREQMEPPWDSLLVPPEPQPEYYETFEDYECAMLRWSALVTATLPVIPPTALQYVDLLGLTLNKVERSEQDAESEQRGQRQYAAVERTEPVLVNENLWDTLQPESQEALRNAVSQLWDNYTRNKRRLQTRYLPDLVGVLHGVFRSHPSRPAEPELNRALMPLRRTDLSGPMLQESLDCPNQVRGRAIDFALPVVFTETIDLRRLRSDYDYRREIQTKERATQFRHRNDYLFSWFHPLVDDEARLGECLERLGSLVTAATLRKMLYFDIYVDTFQQLVKRPKYFGQIVPLFSRPEPLEYALNILHHSNEPTVQGKFAKLFIDVLNSRSAGNVMRTLVMMEDLQMIYQAAMLVSQFNETPEAIFHVEDSVLRLLRPFFGDVDVLPFVRAVSNVYYWRFIQHHVKSSDSQRVCEELVQTYTDSVVASLKQMMPSILKGIGSRFVSISHLFLFVLFELMSSFNRNLQLILRDDITGLFDGLRALTKSKLSHVQQAARAVFGKLQEPQWTDFVLGNYVELEPLFEDLSQCRSGTTSGLQRLLVQLLSHHLSRAQVDNLGSLVIMFQNRHELFRWLAKRVLSGDREPSDPSTLLLAQLLESCAKHFARMRLIGGPTYKPRLRTVPDEYTLNVTRAELDAVFAFLKKVPVNNETFGTCSAVLNVLRHMLKSSAFELISKGNDIWLRLVDFCREVKHDQFSYAAWKLVYQLLVYHPGLMDTLIANQMMSRFLGLIGPGAGNFLIKNSLRYLNKFLYRPISHSNRAEKRNVEKDIKLFAKFFVEKNMFIKFHMVYKKFSKAHNGAPWQRIAGFYHVLHSVPACAKIVQAAVKEEEYRVGLDAVRKMFQAPDS